ncbi:MAG: HD domain-containing protein [Spirochaetales bacterium]
MEVHGKDVRKGTKIPYMVHLLGVCALVLLDEGKETEAIAALLHDTLEDHPEQVTATSIEEQFGTEVLSIIQGCSDTSPDYRGGPKPPWKERKQYYLNHLEELFTGSNSRGNGADSAPTYPPSETLAVSILRVSLADKVDNVRSMVKDYREDGEAFWERFNAGKEDQIWYLASLLDVYHKGHERLKKDKFLLEEFKRSFEELKQLAGYNSSTEQV